ncbi:MAG: hypothetical protein H7317_16035 [Pseudorhodobacter sp.]|nr:hypothetical protein [Pseudorhodobacter sp.]
MIRWLPFLIWLLFPAQAWGQAAPVTSGDHPDFTRIVVQYAAAEDWKVGRTADGYELRLPQAGMQYDLTRTFDLIQKDRLAAVWTDPKTGALHLSIACACFAMPFEFRPGTVVIDIRNGAPPKGSEFELSLDGGAAPTLDSPTGGPQLRYDWTTLAVQPRPPSLLPAPGLAPPAPQRDLEPLRQSLVEQLAMGASAGIVDMAKPKHVPDDAGGVDVNPSVEVRSGDQAQMLLRQKGEAHQPMTAKGQSCFNDAQVNVATWAIPAEKTPIALEEVTTAGKAKTDVSEKTISIGGPLQKDLPIAMQFAPAMEALTGEFDRPEPDAIRRAVKFDLFLGFGAEARGLLRALPIQDKDAPIWQSMARIADEESDPAPAFTGMEACDTGAALWAVLADPKVLGVGQVQKAAILRAFSALPAHLRLHFGPTLVDRFLAMKDFGTATALRDAVTRADTVEGAEVQMMQAAIDKASGSPGASVARLETVVAQSGPSNGDALVALILQRAELGQDVSYDQVQAIAEYSKERKDSEDHEKYQQALTLAYAASGDFDNAFKNLANGPDAASTLWMLLVNSGPDSAVLTYGVLENDQPPPRASRGAAGLMADRLLRLGLADQAERWLAASNSPPPLLSARIAVAQGAPQQALMMLGDLSSNAATKVRLDALTLMGDQTGIAKLFDDLGMDQEHWNAVGRTGDWQALAKGGPDVWKAAAATLGEQPKPTPAPDAPPSGPLAQDQALIKQSTATRDAITALLDAVKSPAALSQ